MPFEFHADPDHPEAQPAVCLACHAAGRGCLVDTRINRVKDRETEFQVVQQRVMDCALGGFVPGTDSDPDPDRLFLSYRMQAFQNARVAGKVNFPGFRLTAQQMGKVSGDVYEMMDAAALWNAAAVWKQFMDTGSWNSNVFIKPHEAVPTPTRKVAIVKMSRGADTTLLLNPTARGEYEAFSGALARRGMELKLSTPDMLGLRIPDPMPPGYEIFMKPLPDLSYANQTKLETAWAGIQSTLEGRHFLFAIAAKTSARSDRLYKALFEANVLKYILGYVLRGPAIRFIAHVENTKGSDIVGRYSAASMTSLLSGGVPTRAVDDLYVAIKPRDTAQRILDELPTYPL